MKGYVSLHNHTVFCDGADDVEAMCRAAHDAGLDAVGFSAHAPVGRAGLRTRWHLPDERLEEYLDEVGTARRRWDGRLAVYLGLEVDYIRGLRSARDGDVAGLIADGVLDYAIGAVHYALPLEGDPLTFVTVDGPLEELQARMRAAFGGDGEAVAGAYWDAVLEMVALGGFDVVGHLDLVKKHNGKARWFDEEGAAHLARAEEAARAIAAAGLVVEANTGGMNRGYLSEPFPSLSILRILRRRGVPVVISADAHRAAHIAGHYAQAREFLREAGYASHVVFEGRRCGKAIWRERDL